MIITLNLFLVAASHLRNNCPLKLILKFNLNWVKNIH